MVRPHLLFAAPGAEYPFMSDYTSTPRLFTAAGLAAGYEIILAPEQAHYLKNVLRLQPTARLRLFNGRDGEWLAVIIAVEKKSASVKLLEQTRKQPVIRKPLHLLFAPLKKDRLDFLVEKAVELGVTDLHPTITNRTEIRKINEDRLQAQITEAAEQCERLEIPRLHPLADLSTRLTKWEQSIPLYACIERFDAPVLRLTPAPAAFLIGPVGGFDDAERELVTRYSFVQPVSLGETVLRAETAALKCLSLIENT